MVGVLQQFRKFNCSVIQMNCLLPFELSNSFCIDLMIRFYKLYSFFLSISNDYKLNNCSVIVQENA